MLAPIRIKRHTTGNGSGDGATDDNVDVVYLADAEDSCRSSRVDEATVSLRRMLLHQSLDKGMNMNTNASIKDPKFVPLPKNHLHGSSLTLIEEVVRMAETSTSLSFRGTCFYVICLLSRTRAGME